MIKTGLTDREKESLLKFFLTNGSLKFENGKHTWEFFNNYTFAPIEKDLPELILKAHKNLTLSAMRVIDEMEFGIKNPNEEQDNYLFIDGEKLPITIKKYDVFGSADKRQNDIVDAMVDCIFLNPSNKQEFIGIKINSKETDNE